MMRNKLRPPSMRRLGVATTPHGSAVARDLCCSRTQAVVAIPSNQVSTTQLDVQDEQKSVLVSRVSLAASQSPLM